MKPICVPPIYLPPEQRPIKVTTSLYNLHADLRPISDRIKQNYLNRFKTVRNASIAKRTTDEEEPALVTLPQIVEDYRSRTDQVNSTRAMTRSAILWIIKSGKVEHTEDAINALSMLEELKNKDGPNETIPHPKTTPTNLGTRFRIPFNPKSANSGWHPLRTSPPTEHSHRIIPIDKHINRQAINMYMGFIEELIPQHLDNLERETAFVSLFYPRCAQCE